MVVGRKIGMYLIIESHTQARAIWINDGVARNWVCSTEIHINSLPEA